MEPAGTTSTRTTEHSISICTFSRNRLDHVKGFFDHLLPALDPLDEVIYVDYSDPQNSKDWVVGLAHPQVWVYEVPGLEYWQASHAHNCAGIHATRALLFFCDIDGFLTKRLLDIVRSTVTERAFITGRGHWPKPTAVSYGSCAVHRKMFERVHGYEEMFTGWAHEDNQFYARLRANGYKELSFPQESPNKLPGKHVQESNCKKIDPFNTLLTDWTIQHLQSPGFQNNFQRTIGYGSRLYLPGNQS